MPSSLRTSHLPLAVDVSGLRCLVVGGGRIGTRKALKLIQAGAQVTVLSPDISPRLEGALARGEVGWVRGRYAPQHLAGRLLVVAATDSARLNLAIRDDCEKRGVLSCVVSPGRSSRVLFPAVHRGEHLTVAVHSDGRDCAASRRARDRLARLLASPAPQDRQFCVFGTERGRVPEPFFAGLGLAARRWTVGFCYGRDFVQAMLLSTCQRWEFWFLAASPAAGSRELRGAVHRASGLLVEEHGGAFGLLSGPEARQHALRVACGLDSPLPGETEVVGQIRRARDRYLPEPRTEMRSIVDEILVAQRSIRKEAGLQPVGGGWAKQVSAWVGAKAAGARPSTVLLLGMGPLGAKILEGLRTEGHEVLAVCERSDCRQADIFTPDLLPELVGRAKLAVLTSAEGSQREFLERANRAGGLSLLDLSSAEGLRRLTGGGLDGRSAAAVSRARSLVFARALNSAAGTPAIAKLRIGARGSRLSCLQAEEARRYLTQALPLVEFFVAAMDTPGDRDRVTPLPEVTGGDFFTRDLDEALLADRIDLAVHSAKDLPDRLPEGLAVAALLPSFAPWECLVSTGGRTLEKLPPGARVGTSSVRREEWLVSHRPDLVALGIRGNVQDRLAQMDGGSFDALLLAAAGLIRLGMESRIAQVFSEEECPPPAGQGALAFVTRSGDLALREALVPLDLGNRRSLPWAV